MEIYFLIVPLVAMVTKVWCNECVESRCISGNSTPNSDGLVVNHGCTYEGAKLYKCQLILLASNDTSDHQGGCVALGNVPGIHQFCNSISIGGERAPAAPPVDDKGQGHDNTVTGTPKDEAIDLRNEYITCIEADVLAGVAVGSFVLGCFLTWAIITVLSQCKALQKELRDVQNPNSSRSNGRGARIVHNFEMSSANQRLLSNGSAESCPSSISGVQMRRHSEDVRHDEGRPFQFRQPLPAPPLHEVAVQPYYAQPIDSLYTCVSDKDYQSIQGGSEHYAPLTEGSDYTSLKGQRVTMVTASSSTPTNGHTVNNDYCTLDGERDGSQDEGGATNAIEGGAADANAIYYPGSDSSNRDYTELIDDSEDDYKGSDHCAQSATSSEKTAAVRQPGNSDPVKFQVSSFAGFGAPKGVAHPPSLPTPGPTTDTITGATNELKMHTNTSNISSAKSMKQDNINEMPDGYEMVQSNTMPPHKKQQGPNPPATNNLDGHTSMASASSSSDTVFTPPDKLGSVATSSYASIDVGHDYDTCNGSIHDYYVLDEK